MTRRAPCRRTASAERSPRAALSGRCAQVCLTTVAAAAGYDRGDQVDPVLGQPAHQEPLRDRLTRTAPQPPPEGGIPQEPHDALRRLGHAVHQETILSVGDLVADAADVAAYDAGSLPHRFGDREAESLAQRLLQHDGRAALQG